MYVSIALATTQLVTPELITLQAPQTYQVYSNELTKINNYLSSYYTLYF